LTTISREEFILKELKLAFNDKILESRIAAPRYIYVTVNKETVIPLVKFLKENFGLRHIVTITGTDFGEYIELIYHLAIYGRTLMVNVKTKVPKDDPEIESIVKLLPGATLYEREVHDLLGVVFTGHPNLERLILPDDWPEGVYPLRKDWKMEGT